MTQAALMNAALFFFLAFVTLLLVMFIGAVIAAPAAPPGSPAAPEAEPPTPPAPEAPAPLPRSRPPLSTTNAAGTARWSDADAATELPVSVYNGVRRPKVSGSPPWGPAPNAPARPLGSRQPRARIAVVDRPEAGVPGRRAAGQPNATVAHARACWQPGQISQAWPGTLISGSRASSGGRDADTTPAPGWPST